VTTTPAYDHEFKDRRLITADKQLRNLLRVSAAGKFGSIFRAGLRGTS